mmetsp:Transcript_6977/g.16127  ORF Transcript_6977/g.16127 Transcript_6977/m.16127 type:complete len:287 (+) Transcript_6977:397-1257(+)
MVVPELYRVFEHALLHLVELRRDRVGEPVHAHVDLLPPEPDHEPRPPLLEVAGSHLDPDRYALLLPVCVLPARVVDQPVVELDPDVLLLERLEYGPAVRRELLDRAGLARDGHDDALERRDAGGQDEPGVVPVDHDHDAYGPRRESPARLPSRLRLALLVLVVDVEHLPEVLAEVVRRRALDGPPGNGDVGLDGRRGVPPGELLLLGLVPRHDRDGQELLVHPAVEVEGLPDHDVGVVEGCVGGVTLLPEELARPEEGRGVLELPPDHVRPLVELQGEVAVAPDPV